MSLLTCLRISYCIPLIYTPILIDNNYYVDGGLIDNYCIQLFEKELKHTIGFVVSNPNDHRFEIDTFQTYLKKVLLTKFINSNNKKIFKYIDNTVYILSSVDTLGNYQMKKELVETGYLLLNFLLNPVFIYKNYFKVYIIKNYFTFYSSKKT